MEAIALRWQKSSHSGNGGGNCVEVARNLPHVVAVRDSKDPHGPVLALTPAMWRDLIADLKAARHAFAWPHKTHSYNER
jgi:Domain of unknown function (DUF397)